MHFGQGAQLVWNSWKLIRHVPRNDIGHLDRNFPDASAHTNTAAKIFINIFEDFHPALQGQNDRK